MNISLSIESFPLDSKTAQDMQDFLKLFETDYTTILHEPLWLQPSARGFVVVAYTEEGQLIGFAASADLVGLHHYEWSAIVHPDHRRQSIGSALADGIQHGHIQREAEGELAACIETPEAVSFFSAIGYEPDFKEMQLGVESLEDAALPEDLTVSLCSEEERAELEALLVASFDEEVVPILSFNLQEEGRDVWVLKREETLIATATIISEDDALWVTAFTVDPKERGKGYGKAFLLWSRSLAYAEGKKQVLLDVETDNESLQIYEKAGFKPIHTVAYWKKED